MCRCIEIVQYVASTDSLAPVVTHTPTLVEDGLPPLRLLFTNAHYSVITAIPAHLLQVRCKHICRRFMRVLRGLRERARTRKAVHARIRLQSLLWRIFHRSKDAASCIQAHMRRHLVCVHLRQRLAACVQRQPVLFPPSSTDMAVARLAWQGRALVRRTRRPVSSAVSRGSVFGGTSSTSKRPYQYRTVRKKLKFTSAHAAEVSTETAPTPSL